MFSRYTKRHRRGIHLSLSMVSTYGLPLPNTRGQTARDDRKNQSSLTLSHREIALHPATGHCLDDSPALLQRKPSMKSTGCSSHFGEFPFSCPSKIPDLWEVLMVFAPLPHSFGEVRSTILFEWHYNMLPGRDQWLFPFPPFDQVSSLRRCAMISRASLSPIPS